MFKKLTLSAAVLVLIVACENTDDMTQKDFTVRIENISQAKTYPASGVFNTPVGASEAGPLLPGNSFESHFSAAIGQKLSFAAMFGQSNDFFYAPDGEGIDLYDAMGNQITGDITDQVMLWDAGTELNQEPGLGADQAPRQSAANTGAADSDNTVRPAADSFNNLPLVADVIQVTLTSEGPSEFLLKIENVGSSTTLSTSDGMTHPAPVSPGVYVIHTDSNVLFAAGQPDMGKGLEAIAEDGDPSTLAAELAESSGITQVFSPGVYAIHKAANPIFTDGVADRGEGLESLAEDGDPSTLAASLSANTDIISSGVYNTPVGASGPAPIGPGETFEFDFTASQGEYLSFASMLGQSNDLFIAPGGAGIALFNGSSANSGDVTNSVLLWDAGTEVNETPGFGANQAPRQSAVNTGSDESGTVREVDDMYEYPALSDLIQVTIISN